MLELKEQLAHYGDYLDSLDVDSSVVTVSGVTRRRSRVAIAAIAACVAVLGVGAVWLVAHQDASSGPRVSPADSAPISDAPPTTTVGEPDIATVQLNPEQQVDWLTRQHESESSVHLPGWRTELGAEAIVCDYAGGPGMPVESMGGSASGFPLGEAITADRIIQECANGTDATRSAGIDLTSQGTLCRSVSTKRVTLGPADAAEPTDVVVTEPAVIFTGDSCEANGYETPAPNFIDTIEQQRRTEILLRAVPRVCPTADEARAWVTRQVKTLPEQWTISISPTTGCALPTVDWWRHTVFAP